MASTHPSNDPAPVVVLVDQDCLETESLIYHLEKAGFRMVTFSSDKAAREYFGHGSMSLVITEFMLPAIDGVELCRVLKREPPTSNVPVVFHSSQTGDECRILALESGADDYIAKPCSTRELILRITRSLQRNHSPAPVEDLVIDDLRIDLRARKVFVAECEVNITETEFRLISALAGAVGKTCSRAMLIENVWGTKISTTSRSLDAHVCRLKLKLGESGSMIQTIHSKGYALQRMTKAEA